MTDVKTDFYFEHPATNAKLEQIELAPVADCFFFFISLPIVFRQEALRA